MSDKAWFAVTPASHGAAVPVRWQGWAALLIHGVTVGLVTMQFVGRPLLGSAVALLLAALPIPFYKTRTRPRL